MAVLMTVILAEAAWAAESLKVSPSKGAVGAEIDVTGDDYDPGDRVYVYFSSSKASVGDDISDLVAWDMVRRTEALWNPRV